MHQALHRDLRQIRLVDADVSLARSLTIREGEPLTSMEEAAYQDGWILRETNESGAVVRAYQRARRRER